MLSLSHQGRWYFEKPRLHLIEWWLWLCSKTVKPIINTIEKSLLESSWLESWHCHVSLSVNANKEITVELRFQAWLNIYISPKYNTRLDALLTLCPNAKLQNSLPPVQATWGLWNPHLLTPFHCCGTSEASEQQHNQDLREKYRLRKISIWSLFTRIHCATNNSLTFI